MPFIMIEFKLAEKMERSEMTAYRLAQITEIHETQIGKLKNGKAKSISFETLDKLCEALNCEPGDLLVRVNSQSRKQVRVENKTQKPKQKNLRSKA
ncbi:MAG: helix-turn-helix transcriptional regulator [Acidobacteria bacterium]|nr:helix-turn-helix transcriptional regulator [Acidobacteriota bacterium]